MLLLTTTDNLRVVTSSTADTDVHASYVDLVTTTVTPGRSNTAITTATTTVVVAAPASGVRNIKQLTVRNKHASTSQDVTVGHYAGITGYELIKVTLSAGDALHYNHQHGWSVRDNLGRVKLRDEQLLTAASPAMSTTVLSADVTNNNGVANTIQDVTGLSFTVVNGATYTFRFFIAYTAAATGTGSRWSINGPTIGSLYYRSEYSLTATTRTLNEGLSTYDVPAASNATSATTGANLAIIEGIITPAADGTVIARFASEVASSAIVAKAGSIVHYQRVMN